MRVSWWGWSINAGRLVPDTNVRRPGTSTRPDKGDGRAHGVAAIDSMDRRSATSSKLWRIWVKPGTVVSFWPITRAAMNPACTDSSARAASWARTFRHQLRPLLGQRQQHAVPVFQERQSRRRHLRRSSFTGPKVLKKRLTAVQHEQTQIDIMATAINWRGEYPALSRTTSCRWKGSACYPPLKTNRSTEPRCVGNTWESRRALR